MSRVMVVEPDRSDPVARLGDWLTEAGLELDVVTDVPALDGYAGVVVLGGPQSADDAALEPVRQLLRDAVSREVPTLGICLGGQLLAAANGGRVAPNPDGPEIGAGLVAKRQAAASDPLFASLPITPDVIQWHFDAITMLPPAAIHLASSPLCEHQAFRLGRLAWGVQFHIEATPEIVASWAAQDAAQLTGYDVELMLRRLAAVDADLMEVWRPFTHTFADIVRDPAGVPPARTVPAATAAPVTDPQAIRAALAAEAAAARTPLPTPTFRPPGDD